MKALHTIFYATAPFLLISCAATYAPPKATPPGPVAEKFEGKRPDLMLKARRTLVADGHQILSADDSSGTISTLPQDFRLTPELADCGTSMGIDYLKDNRTSSKVSYGLVFADGTIAVRAILQSEYKPGDVAQNITLTCVSRGILEQRLLSRLRAS